MTNDRMSKTGKTTWGEIRKSFPASVGWTLLARIGILSIWIAGDLHLPETVD